MNNKDRQYINSCKRFAEVYEALAKAFYKSGNYTLAMSAARQARRNRTAVRQLVKKD